MLSKCELDSDTAQKILLPLIDSTVENLKTLKPAEALTGSFARLDIAAVERHIASIKSVMTAETLEIYLRLGERSLERRVASAGARSAE